MFAEFVEADDLRVMGGWRIVVAVVAFILVLVANVPEGLPATVTSILNLTAQRLAANHVFKIGRAHV